MKRLFFILLSVIAITCDAQEQSQYLGTTNNAVRVRGRMYVDSVLYLPKRQARNASLLDSGALRYQISDSSLYVWTGSTWQKASNETVIDTTIISTKANTQKVVDDTAKVLRTLASSPQVKLNQILNADGIKVLLNSTNNQIWRWTDPSSGLPAMTFETTTGSTTVNSPTVTISKTGTSSGNNTRGLFATNTMTNAAARNVAGTFTATGGLQNYALETIDGAVKFGYLNNLNSRFVKVNAVGDIYATDTAYLSIFDTASLISTKANTQKVVDDTAKVLRGLIGAGGSSKFGKSGEDASGAEARLFDANNFNFTINDFSSYGTYSRPTVNGSFTELTQIEQSPSYSHLYYNVYGAPDKEAKVYVGYNTYAGGDAIARLYSDDNVNGKGHQITVALDSIQIANKYITDTTNIYLGGLMPIGNGGERPLVYDLATRRMKTLTSFPGGSGGGSLSGLTASTANNTINNVDFTQEWQWNSLTASGLKLSSTSTAGANDGAVLEIARSGANASSVRTTIGIKSSVTNTGATSTNTGGKFTVSGQTQAGFGVDAAAQSTGQNNTGVRGIASGASSTNYGVYGDGTTAGVFGTSTSTGVYATSSGTYGGRFFTTATTGNPNGIEANANGATGGTNYGVRGLASGGGDNIGVYGTGGTKGVEGVSTGVNGIGVYGSHTGTNNGYGVYGSSTGAKTNAYGVWGEASGATNNWGLYINAGASFFNGAMSLKTVSKTTTYTADATDHTIFCDATSGAFTINLPSASSVTGRIYIVKKTDASANAVTVDPSGTQTIDGATTYALSAQYKYVQFQAVGSVWYIIANN